MAHELAVVGIGNAIVDVIAHADDAFLEHNGIVKGAMTLIDEARAEALYARMGATTLISGGSAGNTVAGIASLGGRAGYIGKVRDDALGRAYRHDMRASGVRFDTPFATSGESTARCLVLVTSDAQRTLNTYLGACAGLSSADIDAELIGSARYTYMEGYLYDPPHAQAALREAADLAHAAGREVALSLSDAFCVGRHSDAFHELIRTRVDVLFCNEVEIAALYPGASREEQIANLRGTVGMAAITRGAAGSTVVTPDAAIDVPAAPVARVVDTTGAGDLYAAGFLHALAQGRPPRACAELGGAAAAEIISHFGARPETPLAAFVGG